MNDWTRALRDGVLAGSLASVLSAAALLFFGQRDEEEPLGPVNAVSHWVWGDPALQEDRATLRHTLLGYAIHHVASLFWSTLHMYAWHRRRRDEAVKPGPAMAQAGVTAAAACFVDYQLTPRRLTPGFEHRLTKPQLAGVYACFAVGLAIGTVLASRRR